MTEETMKEEELQPVRPVDPLITLSSLADLGMKQMAMSHPELTFHMTLTVIHSLLTDEEKNQMSEIAKSQKTPIHKFLDQEALFYKAMDRLNVGFKRKEKTLYDELMERIEEEISKKAMNELEAFCAENGLLIPEIELIRVVPA